ncbi:MAG: hypothetical protein HQ559_01705 [Lentisphaerae bacterium]|nr:hypothetical protein [Lentisphaerota bacterium]
MTTGKVTYKPIYPVQGSSIPDKFELWIPGEVPLFISAVHRPVETEAAVKLIVERLNAGEK